MAKDKKDKKEEKTLYGQPIYKSGSARASRPEPKHKNEMRLDYNAIQPKKYANTAKTGIDFGEERFPPDAKVPNKRKYDENGNYIKHKETLKKSKEDKVKDPSINNLMRENSLSNPKRENGKKRYKK